MRTVKQAALLLVLVLVALCCEAAPGPDCDGLNKTLTDTQKVIGDWVLVWSAAVTEPSLVFLKHLTTSHVEFQFLDDNNETLVFTEKNLDRNKSCSSYITNITQSSDSSSFRSSDGLAKHEGNLIPIPNNDTFNFFHTCSDCLSMSYRGIHGHYLLIYRREGHHQDVDKVKEAHSDYKKLAECEGIPSDEPYIYDGVSGFCPKISLLDATAKLS